MYSGGDKYLIEEFVIGSFGLVAARTFARCHMVQAQP